MAEQVTRKIEASGNPAGKPESGDRFGNNLGDIFDSLEEQPVIQAKEQDESAEVEIQGNDEGQGEGQDQHQEAEVLSQDSEDQGEGSQELGDLDLPSLQPLDDTPEAAPQDTPQVESDPTKSRADDDDSKNDIKELKSDPHVPAKTKKTIDRLLGKINRLDKLYREKEQEIEAIKSAQAEAPAPDPLSDEDKKELVMLRRRFDLEKDETLKSYDIKAKQAEDTVMDIIRRSVPEKQAEQIVKIGLDAFSKMPQFKQLIGYLNEDDPGEAAIFLNKFAETVSAKTEKRAKVLELSKDAEKWWKEREQSAASQQEQARTQQEQIEKVRASFYENTVSNDPIFRAIETTGLKGEQLAKAEAENAKRSVYQRELKALLRPPQTVDEYKQIVYRAGLAKPLSDKVRGLSAENKALRDKLGKIEQARTTRQSNVATSPKASDEPEDFVAGLTRLAGYRV